MEVLKSATDFLKLKSIENPRLNAEQLLAYTLGMDRMTLYLQFDRPLTQQERNRYKDLLRRRADNEPLQYILGQTEFMSLPFQVGPEVLIPRPETETLVEAVMEISKNQSVRILDIGTGSGCIAISLAYYLPKANLTALDKFEAALSIANQNAKNNQVSERISFAHNDIMDINFSNALNTQFDVVVSNPPYITMDEYKQLPAEIRNFEPIEALTDHGDGLAFYRQLSKISKTILKPNGYLFVETGDTQSHRVQEIFKNDHHQNIESICDLNGIERVIKLNVEQ